MTELSYENEFTIVQFDALVEQASHEQAKEMLKKLHKAYVVQRVMYQELLKKEWQL